MNSKLSLRLRGSQLLDPKSVHAWNNAGAVLGHMGEHDAAVSHLRRALALAPDFLPARENLVHILRRAGYRTRAAFERRKVIARYRKEIGRTPQRAAPLLGLARFLLECGREPDFHEAALLAERAAALRPEDPEALSTLAEAHYRGGNLPRAVRVAERILELGSARLLGNERVHRNTLKRYREAVRTVLGADGDGNGKSRKQSSARAGRRKGSNGAGDSGKRRRA